MIKKKRSRFYLFIISIFLLTPIVVAQGLNVTYDNPLIPRVVITAPGTTTAGGGGNSTFNQTLTDLLYLRLDTSNDPLQNHLDFGDFAALSVGGMTMTGDIDMGSHGINFKVGGVPFAEILSEGNNLTFTNTAGDLVYNINKNIYYGDPSGGDINIRFGIDETGTTNVGLFTYLEDEDYFRFQENITSPNICYSNGSNCQASGSSIDVVNISFINNSQTFSEENVFQENVSFANILFEKGYCAFWNDTSILDDASVCYGYNSGNDLRLKSDGSITLATQTINVGAGDIAQPCLGFKSDGVLTDSNSSLCWDGDNAWWFLTQPLTWTINTEPTIIPSNGFPNTNISFEKLFGNVMTLNGISLIDINGQTAEDFHYNMTIGGGGDTFNNITNNITFVSRPLLSITLNADATASTAEINAFDEDNYASFAYTNNTEWDNVTYHTSSGEFEVLESGRWTINPLMYIETTNIDEALVTIRVNGVDVFSNIICEPHTGVEPQPCIVNIIKELSKNDNVTVFYDSQGGATQAAFRGTTMNLVLLDSPVTDTRGGGQNYLSIQATGTGNTVAEPANPFSSLNYTGYGFHNFADSSTITYDSTLGIFTVPTTDQYEIEVDADGSTASGYTFGRLNIYINGVLNKTSISQTFDSSGEEEWGTSASAIISLNANDNITVGLLGHSGSPSCPCSFNIGEFNGISISNL